MHSADRNQLQLNLHKALLDSIACYEEISVFNEELLHIGMQSDARIILDLGARFKALQADAQKCDLILHHALEKTTAEGVQSLLQQHRQLLEQVATQNRLISEKIHGMMSLISADISQIRGGMTAMSGYRGGREHKGSVLKGAC